MYIGGLDIGTTGCKIVLFDENGKQGKIAYREYNVKRSGGLHEVDASSLYNSVKEVIKEVANEDIRAIGVTSFGESFVMLDEFDAILAPTLLYTDPRGKKECEELSQIFGVENITKKTGTIPHEMYSVSKILWIKNNMPEAFSKLKFILLIQDYIVYRLTGIRQIDYSLAARTGCFDIRKKCWISELLEYAGINENNLSLPVPSGTIAGNIKDDIAEELGISNNTCIVSGCQDQIAALVGADVLEDGQAMDGIGTVECVPVVMNEIPIDFELYKSGYSVVPHINGNYACYALSYAGGATLKWFRDNFANVSYSKLDSEISDKPTDLLIMPHFAGAATPYMDTASKAAIIGLTFEHTRSDIYKALMEGTSYEMLLNLKKLSDFSINVKSVRATGGGAKSDVWLQIKTDVFGIPVASLDGDEIGGAGTALLSGRAVGIYNENTKLLKEKKVYYPNTEKHEIYERYFKKYEKIYTAQKEVISDE